MMHLWLLSLTLVPLAEPTGNQPASPYLRSEFRSLMDAVTLHLSFDDGNMGPEMAAGEQFQPAVFGSWADPQGAPKFESGLIGNALMLGTGGAVYPRAGNVLLETRGAIALWIKPQQWQRPRDGNCVFVMTSNATFYLERQGPDVDDEGRVRRQEGILYLANVPGSRGATVNGGSDWGNGRWYLLVANWSWPTMELSVNGEPFAVRSLSQTPAEQTFGQLVVGDRSGQARGLLDELFAFRRPLTLEEVRLLWQLHTVEESTRDPNE